MKQPKKTPYTMFFEHAASRVERANGTLKKVAERLIEHPEITLQFIVTAVMATAFRSVYLEVYGGRNLLPKESEEGALRRVKTYAEDQLRLLGSKGVILSSGLLDQALAAEKIHAWTDVLACLKDVTRNEPKDKKL